MDLNMPSWIHLSTFFSCPDAGRGVFLFHFSWQDSTRVSSCLYPRYACFVTGLQSPGQNTRQKCQTLTPTSFWETTDKEGSPRLGGKRTACVSSLKSLSNPDDYKRHKETDQPEDHAKEQKIDRKGNGTASKGAWFYKAWPSFMRNK